MTLSEKTLSEVTGIPEFLIEQSMDGYILSFSKAHEAMRKIAWENEKRHYDWDTCITEDFSEEVCKANFNKWFNEQI